MHRTLVLFAPSIIAGDKVQKKKYIPFSDNEKIMFKLYEKESLSRSGSIAHETEDGEYT